MFTTILYYAQKLSGSKNIMCFCIIFIFLSKILLSLLNLCDIIKLQKDKFPQISRGGIICELRE